MNYRIEKMSLDDCTRLSQNLLNDFDDFWTPSSLMTELKNENNYFIVAKEDDIIVGFAGMLVNIDYTEILNIVVHNDFRRKGIAQLLLDSIIEYTKQLQKNSITLEVNEQNTAAIKLYVKNDFKEVGRRKKYYNNTNDAILMTKEL